MIGLLFGSLTLTIILLAITVIVCIYSEYDKNGITAFLFVVGLVIVNYFWGTFNLMPYLTAFNIVSYLLLGILYSFIKTIFYGKHMKNSYPSSCKDDDERNAYLMQDLKENILRWILMFPISLLYWIFSDLLIQLWDVIYKYVKRFYDWLFLLGTKL